MPEITELFDAIIPPRPASIIPDAPERVRKNRYEIVNPRATAAEIERSGTTAADAQLNISGRDEPARVLLGRVRVGAYIPWATVYADTLVIVCIWGRSGPEGYDAVETISMNNAALPYGSVATHHLGNQTTVNTFLAALLLAAGYGSFTDAMTGVCWTLLEIPQRDYSTNLPYGNPVNIGEIHAVVRGLKAYDPRDGAQSPSTPSTWLYTNNPALLTARIASDTTLGAAIPANAAAWTSVTAAANWCDNPLTGGGATKRFTLNTVIADKAPAETHLKALSAYGSFWLIPENGSFLMVIDGPETPGATITKDDIIPGTFRYQGLSNKDRANLVFIRYTQPNLSSAHAPWDERIAPQGADIPSLPSGEMRRVNDLPMPGITTYDQALRTAKALRNHDYTEDLTMSFQMTQKALALFKGDVRPITYGIFTAKNMRLVAINLADRGYFDTSWREYDAAAYSNTWTTAPSTPDTLLPDPNVAPDPVTALVLTEIPITNDSATSAASRIRAHWTAGASPFFANHIVTITDSDDTSPTAIFQQTVVGDNYTSPPLPSPNRYRASVVTANAVGRLSLPTSELIGLTNVSGLKFLYKTITNPTGFSGTGVPVTRIVDGDTSALTLYPSPYIDLGSVTNAIVTLEGFAEWLADPSGGGFHPDCLRNEIVPCDEDGNPILATVVQPFAGTVVVTCRYVRMFYTGQSVGSGGFDLTAHNWRVELPEVSESVIVTTSAGALVAAPLVNRFIATRGVHVTPKSAAGAVPSYETPVIGELLPNSIQVEALVAGARVVRECTITMYGAVGDNTLTDWAQDVNGATAAATSATLSAAANAITGVLDSASNSGWQTGTAHPQTLTVTFTGAKPISEWVIVFLKDVYGTAGEPTVFDTGTLYLATSFTIEGWNGSAWITEQTITGNNKVMRRFAATPGNNYSKGRITIAASQDGASRVVAFRAIGPA